MILVRGDVQQGTQDGVFFAVERGLTYAENDGAGRINWLFKRFHGKIDAPTNVASASCCLERCIPLCVLPPGSVALFATNELARYPGLHPPFRWRAGSGLPRERQWWKEGGTRSRRCLVQGRRSCAPKAAAMISASCSAWARSLFNLVFTTGNVFCHMLSRGKKRLMENMSQARSAAPLLSFWVIGDMHYYENEPWKKLHLPRMEQLFRDLQSIWREEGYPAFCVSPGDVIENGAPANYALAKREILANLAPVPFYPGIGNHEYFPTEQGGEWHTAEEHSAAWGRSLCYAWTVGDVVCMMLEQPQEQWTVDGMPLILLSPEALAFLETTLTEHAERTAIIFAHCPLYNTVLDRDPEQNLDDDSLAPYFFVSNSEEVRAILARHRKAALYITGHTHSGWGSPRLVFTESLGAHAITHLNVMSPWYTGFTGPKYNQERQELEFLRDTPDVQATFSIQIYPHKIRIRARDHQAQNWLAEWEVEAVRH